VTPEEFRQKERIRSAEYRARNLEKERLRRKLYRDRNPERTKAYRDRNREKIRARQRDYQARNLEARRASQRRRSGIPEPTRPCPDACEMCLTQASALRTGLCIDHDHATGRFRGWICHSCNTSLGKMGDDIAEARLRLDRYERAGQ
jgi:hypothetical protein